MREIRLYLCKERVAMSYLSSQRLTERSSMVVTSTAVGVDCTWPEGLDTFEAVVSLSLILSANVEELLWIVTEEIFFKIRIRNYGHWTLHLTMLSRTRRLI